MFTQMLLVIMIVGQVSTVYFGLLGRLNGGPVCTNEPKLLEPPPNFDTSLLPVYGAAVENKQPQEQEAAAKAAAAPDYNFTRRWLTINQFKTVPTSSKLAKQDDDPWLVDDDDPRLVDDDDDPWLVDDVFYGLLDLASLGTLLAVALVWSCSGKLHWFFFCDVAIMAHLASLVFRHSLLVKLCLEVMSGALRWIASAFAYVSSDLDYLIMSATVSEISGFLDDCAAAFHRLSGAVAEFAYNMTLFQMAIVGVLFALCVLVLRPVCFPKRRPLGIDFAKNSEALQQACESGYLLYRGPVSDLEDQWSWLVQNIYGTCTPWKLVANFYDTRRETRTRRLFSLKMDLKKNVVNNIPPIFTYKLKSVLKNNLNKTMSRMDPEKTLCVVKVFVDKPARSEDGSGIFPRRRLVRVRSLSEVSRLK